MHCHLPKAGLGNQLFPLLSAYTFGYLNNLPVKVTGYHQFKIGPYLRGEKIKRNYSNYFRFQKSILGEAIDRIQLQTKGWQKQEEPLLEVVEKGFVNQLYYFSAIPHWRELFLRVRQHRDIIIRLFYDLLSSDIKKRLEQQEVPCIGVHIRMGDFRKLKPGEDFGKVGVVRTAETYFIEIIERIRALHGSVLPVTVFTDGHLHEFDHLFQLPGVKMAGPNPDIIDLLLLSRSRVIVASVGSTFSYWAGFFSEAPLIRHPQHLHSFIRPDDVNSHWYEGPIPTDPVPALLSRNIQSIVC
ncbi:MAG TPA: alpha-1,2-fucosyltransferase [Flavitalea sp.]|nr:alpha-1,2-fucosyltransferase [Flavitalea sp.]